MRSRPFPTLVLAASLLAARPLPGADDPFADPGENAPAGGFSTRHLFAATRSLWDDPMHPAWKVAVAPAALAVDTAALPLALALGVIDP